MTAKQTPCFCRSFEFGEFDGDNESAESYNTGCNQSTTKVFAQGHDAKLAGFLVRAELAGEEIRMVEGGVAISSDARRMAAKVSEAFEAKVVALLDAARRRLAKKALNEAIKAARKSAKAVKAIEAAPVPTTREARIKVGRWEYNATIEIATGRATHERKLGGTRTVALGEYKEV